MRFLAAVKGCTRQDDIRYTDVTEKLEIFAVNNKLKEHRQKWMDYVDRMEYHRIVRMEILLAFQRMRKWSIRRKTNS